MDLFDRIFAKLEGLQQKPVHIRKRILLASTATLSTLIVLAWAFQFPSTLENIQRRIPDVAKGESPFAALMGTIREAGKSVSAIGEDLEDQLTYVRAVSEAALRQQQAASTTPSAASSSPPSATSTLPEE
jgi:hypothetical protein